LIGDDNPNSKDVNNPKFVETTLKQFQLALINALFNFIKLNKVFIIAILSILYNIDVPNKIKGFV